MVSNFIHKQGKWAPAYKRVQHVARQEDTGDVDEVVTSTSNTSGQGSKTDGGRLSDDNPRSRGRSQSEQDGDDETQRCLCERRRC